MKRVLLVLVVLAVVAAGVFFFLRRPGVSEGAQLLPAGTVVYAALPDVKRTIDRWPKTALARIGAEPSVAAFLKKPLALAAERGGLEGLDLILRVKPGRLFFAVTGVRETGADVVLGFQFFGGRKELDGAMERLYRELGKAIPDAKPTTADYQGGTITTFAGPAPLLFTGVQGSWAFLSNREGAVKNALDRAAGRDHSPSLADSANYRSVATHLAAAPDLAWFLETKPLVDLVLEIGKGQPNTAINQQQLEELRKIQAAGGTLWLDGADQRESTFVLYPDAPKLPFADRASMALTTPATLFYYDTSVDWSTVSRPEYQQSLPPEVRAFLAAAKIDLAQVSQIFGTDLGLTISWPPSATIPTLLAVLEVKDRAKVEALTESVLTNVGVQTTQSELHGAKVYGLPSPAILLDPSLAVGDKFVYAALTSAEIERALTVKSGTPTLESTDAFKPALSAYKADNQAFGYLDSRALFEGVYNRLRPVAVLAAALTPDVAKYVDIDKLPETDAIGKHLSAIVYTNRQVDGGWLIESSGPVTLSQAVFAGAFGGAAAYATQLKGR